MPKRYAIVPHDRRVRLRDLVSVLPFGLGVFLMGGGVGIATKYSYDVITTGHAHDVVNDIYLYRTLLFGSLAYGFNFCFGCAFGLAYTRFFLFLYYGGKSWLRWFPVNPMLVIFCLWWVLFNLPVLSFGARGYPFGLKTLAWLSHLYTPVANDLQLYFYMGNFALIGSFLFAVSLSRFWERVFGISWSLDTGAGMAE